MQGLDEVVRLRIYFCEEKDGYCREFGLDVGLPCLPLVSINGGRSGKPFLLGLAVGPEWELSGRGASGRWRLVLSGHL